jgi:PadR family transcriptional regulator, regulatory protein AphA
VVDALSTTSYSILGYLAVQPWSAYELTKQLGRTFHHFWPRAESGIYREVKRLETAGFATSSPEQVGRRHRTRYEITTAGRDALREWLAEPHSDGFLESEGLVRVLFADHGSVEILQATLRAMVDDAKGRADAMAAVVESYVAGEGQFPSRSHINVLIARFLVDFAVMVDDWAEWAEGFVATWPDVAPRPLDEATLAELRETVSRRGR